MVKPGSGQTFMAPSTYKTSENTVKFLNIRTPELFAVITLIFRVSSEFSVSFKRLQTHILSAGISMPTPG